MRKSIITLGLIAAGLIVGMIPGVAAAQDNAAPAATTPPPDPAAPSGNVARRGTTESGARVCYGATGAITRLWGDVQERVLTGLPSLAVNDPASPNRTGQAANGPPHIATGITSCIG